MNDTELAAGFIVSVDGAATPVLIVCLYVAIDWTRPKFFIYFYFYFCKLVGPRSAVD